MADHLHQGRRFRGPACQRLVGEAPRRQVWSCPGQTSGSRVVPWGHGGGGRPGTGGAARPGCGGTRTVPTGRGRRRSGTGRRRAWRSWWPTLAAFGLLPGPVPGAARAYRGRHCVAGDEQKRADGALRRGGHGSGGDPGSRAGVCGGPGPDRGAVRREVPGGHDRRHNGHPGDLRARRQVLGGGLGPDGHPGRDWLSWRDVLRLAGRGARFAEVVATGGHFLSVAASTRERREKPRHHRSLDVFSVHTPVPSWWPS